MRVIVTNWKLVWLKGKKMSPVAAAYLEYIRQQKTVINENQFWDVIDELKNAGAEDILIVPIDKMVI